MPNEFEKLFAGTSCGSALLKSAGYSTVSQIHWAPTEVLAKIPGLKRPDLAVIKGRAKKLEESWTRSVRPGKRSSAQRTSGFRPLRAFTITVTGAHKKKHTWTTHSRPTLADIQEELSVVFPDTLAADYTLTWKISNDVLESDFEALVDQWGSGSEVSGAEMKVELTLKLLTKVFSSFGNVEGLKYLGLPPTYVIEEKAAEFPAMEKAEDTIVMESFTFGDLLLHVAKDLRLRRLALGSPEVDATEQSRRELISPVLVLAVLLLEEMHLVAEKRLLGSLGNGPLDYAVLWRDFKTLISECKREHVSASEGQALAQTAAAREEYVRTKVTGFKRKRTEIDEFLPVPSTTIISTGTSYLFYRYYPREGEKQRSLVKSSPFSLDFDDVTTVQLMPRLKKVVCAIAGALSFQRTQLEDAIKSARLKLEPKMPE